MPDDDTDTGMASLSSGNFAAAAIHFECAIARQPTDDRAWFGLGMARFRLGDYKGAESAFTQCIEVPTPRTGVCSAYALRFMARINLGDRAAALDDFQKAVKDPAVCAYFQFQHRKGAGQAFLLMTAYPLRSREILQRLRGANGDVRS
jgi:Flp pilus assembly protein TadD